MARLQEAITAASPYFYAGAIRVGVSDTVALLRDQVLARVPGERVAAVTTFLRSPVGEGMLRLALAGVIAGIPRSKRPELLQDAQQECFVSSITGGLISAQDLACVLAEKIRERLSFAPPEES